MITNSPQQPERERVRYGPSKTRECDIHQIGLESNDTVHLKHENVTSPPPLSECPE